MKHIYQKKCNQQFFLNIDFDSILMFAGWILPRGQIC